MSDFDLPDLPSDEELGITDEDKEKYGDELPDDGPELSEEEVAALLGGSASSPPSAPKSSATGASPGSKSAAKKKAKEGKKKAREAEKEAKRKAKEERRRAKAAEKAAAERPAAAKTTSGAEKTSEVGAGGGSAAGSSGGATTGDGSSEGATGSAGKERSQTGDGGAPPGGAGANAGGGPGSRGGSPPGPAPAALAPMPGWRGPVTFLLVLILSVFASTRTGDVDPVPANAGDSDFSSARAMAIVEDIAREAHPPGSPEHERVRGFLLERLTQLGLEPEVQTATSFIEGQTGAADRPPAARAATVRNVLARIPGSNPSGTVLVTAHYDSRTIAPGAGDDASGVAAILEAVRALQTGPTLRNDIIVLLTDAEELGLLGARAFVDQHPWMPEVDLVLSFEMRGGGGPSIMFETNERNGWVVRALQDFDPHPFANSMAFEVYERMPRDTDFTPFRDAGVQGLNFAAIDNAHVYHQVYDSPANLSEATLQHHGVRALEGLRYFGNADLTSVNDANVVFFSVPGLGLVVYDRLWVLAVSVLIVGLFGLLLMAARRADARPGRMAAGAVVFVTAAAAAYFITDWTFATLTPLHPEYGALQGSAFHHEGWYVLGLTFMALLLVVGSGMPTRRWIAPLELAVGALVVPLAAAVAAGFVAPLAAMNLQWPVAAAILSVTLMALLGARASGMVGWVVALALAVPVVIMLQPVIELLWLALSLEVAGVLAVLAVTGFFLMLPLLGSLNAPNRWWAPLTLVVLTAGCVATGVLTRGPSAEAPAPSTLIYAHEHGDESAMWVTAPRDSAHAGAFDWATERAAGDFTGTADLEGFGHPGSEVAVAPARVLLVEPPRVEIVTDTVIGQSRRTVIHVTSAIGAEMLGFQVGGDTRLTAIDGQPLSNVDRLRWLEHWGLPDTAVVLELATAPGSPLDLHVVEHLLRPEELLGRDAFARPPELAPNINRLSDRAMFRYPVPDTIAGTGTGDMVDPTPASVDPTPAPVDTTGAPVDTTSASGGEPGTRL